MLPSSISRFDFSRKKEHSNNTKKQIKKKTKLQRNI